MPRPRRRAFGLLGGAFLLFGVGTNVQAGWLLVLSAMLAGAVVTGVAVPPLMTRGILVRRRAPSEAFAGEDVEVDLVVRNTSNRTALSLETRDAHIAPASAFVASLAPGEEVSVRTLRRAARRGVVDGGPVTIVSSAPFGVAESRRTVEAPGRTVIYPRVVPLPERAADRAWSAHAGTLARPRRGPGDEFFGVREYQSGDSLRYIHWPSSARAGTLVVREFEREQPRRLAILVDTSTDAGDGDETTLDVSCSVAASYAVRALGRGEEVVLGAARDGELRLVERPDRTEALTWLADLRAPGRMPFGAVMDEAWAFVRGFETVLLACSSARANAGIASRVDALRATGGEVLAAVADESTFARSGEPAGGLARALAGAGAVPFVIRAKEDLEACLRTVSSSAG